MALKKAELQINGVLQVITYTKPAIDPEFENIEVIRINGVHRSMCTLDDLTSITNHLKDFLIAKSENVSEPKRSVLKKMVAEIL